MVAALCCGLPLPDRFHMTLLPSRERSSDGIELPGLLRAVAPARAQLRSDLPQRPVQPFADGRPHPGSGSRHAPRGCFVVLKVRVWQTSGRVAGVTPLAQGPRALLLCAGSDRPRGRCGRFCFRPEWACAACARRRLPSRASSSLAEHRTRRRCALLAFGCACRSAVTSSSRHACPAMPVRRHAPSR
jgi:hypothetical protein